MTIFSVQKGAMWKISGMLIKFYFLACVDQYKRLLIVYFLHKCPWHAFAKIFLSQIFPSLTYATQNKIWSPCHSLQNPQDLTPSTFFPFASHTRTTKQAPIAGPCCTLCLQPWKLCSPVPLRLIPHFIHMYV